jgi:hypothetical protein
MDGNLVDCTAADGSSDTGSLAVTRMRHSDCCRVIVVDTSNTSNLAAGRSAITSTAVTRDSSILKQLTATRHANVAAFCGILLATLYVCGL